ncbi:hypothetical protein EST38_g4603 [Candolleomyces aberdarensis]|uniref:Uncharacterized protein n=1 Tax=Candolleomyces aberdarensis TaxID=2316362 RepID=A0A4Q2DPY3_9AGAR|nr:hypothetical protein EST38_g4603 [Candolleomyces aberdarensis]
MPLKPGLYQIRYVPAHVIPPFVGGLTAVGEDINKPVAALPVLTVPPYTGVRDWEVTAVPDKKNQYVIATKPFKSPSTGVGPIRAGWGRELRKPVDIEGLDPSAAARARSKADIEAEEEGILPYPGTAVPFTTEIVNWTIEEASDGGGDPNKVTYRIIAPTVILDAIPAVSVYNNILVVENYPKISIVDYQIPTWQFVPVRPN